MNNRYTIPKKDLTYEMMKKDIKLIVDETQKVNNHELRKNNKELINANRCLLEESKKLRNEIKTLKQKFQTKRKPTNFKKEVWTNVEGGFKDLKDWTVSKCKHCQITIRHHKKAVIVSKHLLKCVDYKNSIAIQFNFKTNSIQWII